MESYDVIVIGSGIGGMGAASILAQLRGKRVLVLERHFTLGGFSHAFTRQGYVWDVGLHYVGQMGPSDQPRKVMDLLTRGDVAWEPMPEVFDVFHYPDRTVGQPSDPQAWAERLIGEFPAEERAIRRYLRDVGKVATWASMETMRWGAVTPVKVALGLANARLRATALTTTGEYLERNVRDPQLRGLLASQWGDYTLPPSRSSFAIHSLIVAHYLGGAWYPTGGSEALTAAMRRAVEDAGGSCLVNHTVSEILLENGRAVGVRAGVKKGRGGQVAEFRAPVIISDAGARATFEQLLPGGVADDMRTKLARAESGPGSVGVYVGLRESPERLGFRGENHWYFAGYDHDVTLADSARLLEGRPSHAYLSFPSLKDPSATSHTAEILASLDPEAFARWAGTRWQRRGADYVALKEQVAEGLIGLVERHHPGFADLVAYREVATPLTVATFHSYASGGFADLAATPQRFRDQLVPARTGVPGLFVSGADACALGIVGAAMGAVFAAGAVMGPAGVGTVMTAAARGSYQGPETRLATSSPGSGAVPA